MLSRQPSQQWRDEARRAQRDRAARSSQVGWRPQTNLQRGDPRVRARDGTQAGQVLQAPNMPGFNNGPAARRSNVPIVCCGMLMERDSRQFRIVKILVGVDMFLLTICLLIAHDTDEDGLTLAGYTLGLMLTACFAPLLIVAPFIVAAVCKCWYDRKIEAAIQNTLIATSDEAVEEAEEARLERMRAEMASTVMSDLRGDNDQPVADEAYDEPSGYMGHTIVQGEVLGDIILLDENCAPKPVSAMPVTPTRIASAELSAHRSASISTRTATFDGDPSAAAARQGFSDINLDLAAPEFSRSGTPSSPIGQNGSSYLRPNVGQREPLEGALAPTMIPTGQVLQPQDWRLYEPR